jgi:glycyl-tRNA synthetase
VNKDGLQEAAMDVIGELQDTLNVFYDDSGSIGRRYARADEAGVPFCVTLDYETLKDKSATVRERDSRKQDRVPLDGLAARLGELTRFPRM